MEVWLASQAEESPAGTSETPYLRSKSQDDLTPTPARQWQTPAPKLPA